jgi:hypothetical protein
MSSRIEALCILGLCLIGLCSTMRLGEIGTLLNGVLHVGRFTQNDGHTFCARTRSKTK